MEINIRTIRKQEEHGTQFCNKYRAEEYKKSLYNLKAKHKVVKSVTYRNCEPVYCYTVVMV